MDLKIKIFKKRKAMWPESDICESDGYSLKEIVNRISQIGLPKAVIFVTIGNASSHKDHFDWNRLVAP